MQNFGIENQAKEIKLQNTQKELEKLTKGLNIFIRESKKDKLKIKLRKNNKYYLKKLKESNFKLNSLESENKILLNHEYLM